MVLLERKLGGPDFDFVPQTVYVGDARVANEGVPGENVEIDVGKWLDP